MIAVKQIALILSLCAVCARSDADPSFVARSATPLPQHLVDCVRREAQVLGDKIGHGSWWLTPAELFDGDAVVRSCTHALLRHVARSGAAHAQQRRWLRAAHWSNTV